MLKSTFSCESSSNRVRVENDFDLLMLVINPSGLVQTEIFFVFSSEDLLDISIVHSVGCLC